MAAKGVPQFKRKPRPSPQWMENAACVDANPRIFFDPTRYAQAQLVCLPCPVKEACRRSRGTAEGVWGGRVYEPRKKRVAV